MVLFSVGSVKVSVYKGDLTNERVDVIVNAANNFLRHDGGVANAILYKGGKVIETESNKIIRQCGSLRDGDAVLTGAGKLPCKKVIHAVGPDCGRVKLPQSRVLLRQACLNSLNVALESKMTSIALPAISSGSYGMPKDACAKIMFDAVEEFVRRQGNPKKKKKITDIRFVNIDDHSVLAFRTEFISRYGNSKEHSDSKKLTGGSSMKFPPNGVEGATSSLLSLSRSDRGKNNNKQSSDNGRTTKSPSDEVGSHHHNAVGSTNASTDHPPNVSNPLSHPPTSYSSAVKNNTGGGTDARSSTAQEPGGTGKTGSQLALGSPTDRKDEGKGNKTNYTKHVTFITISSDNYKHLLNKLFCSVRNNFSSLTGHVPFQIFILIGHLINLTGHLFA